MEAAMADPWTLTGNATSARDFLGTTNAQPLAIRTNGRERVTVSPTGNVGVGTTDPQVRLHVAGNRVRVESGPRRLDLRADGGAVDIQSDTHNLFLHSSGPSNRNHVIINPFGNEGNVGIGTQGPATKLHVVGNRVRLEAGGKRLDLRADGGAVDIQSDTHNLFLHSSGPSNRNHVIINPFGNEGNVGIGTQSPAQKLHVAGNIQANDVIIVSDAQAKRDVEPIDGATEKLQQLRAVAFRRVSEDGGSAPARRSLGVLAQEVEPVLPELVHTPESGGFMGVNYSGLTALLIESVKELVAENRALRERIEIVEAALGGRGQAEPSPA
jgi:hypothetical protein